MQQHQDPEVIAEMRATTGRRVVGAVAMGGLGLALFYTATVAGELATIVKGFVIIAGATALWATQIMWRDTAGAVQLTAQGLRDTHGRVIAPLEDIEIADRGVFAFKPSNGLTLKLRHPGPVAWRMGLWWRMGKRVGVGGMTPAHQAKFMSERITTLVNGDGSQH